MLFVGWTYMYMYVVGFVSLVLTNELMKQEYIKKTVPKPAQAQGKRGFLVLSFYNACDNLNRVKCNLT